VNYLASKLFLLIRGRKTSYKIIVGERAEEKEEEEDG